MIYLKLVYAYVFSIFLLIFAVPILILRWTFKNLEALFDGFVTILSRIEQITVTPIFQEWVNLTNIKVLKKENRLLKKEIEELKNQMNRIEGKGA